MRVCGFRSARNMFSFGYFCNGSACRFWECKAVPEYSDTAAVAGLLDQLWRISRVSGSFLCGCPLSTASLDVQAPGRAHRL